MDRFLGIPICAALSLIYHFRGKRLMTAAPRKILVTLLSEMGSLVLAAPMLARLKQRYPNASIYIVVFAKNRGLFDILQVIPQQNVLTLDDRSVGKFATDALRIVHTLRSLKIDTVIDCELFSRISSILSYLSGAQIRVGFHRHTQEGLYRGSFINRPVMYNPYRHISQQFLTMVDAIDSTTVPVVKHRSPPDRSNPPTVRLPEEELRQVGTQFHADFPAVGHRNLVLIYPGGGMLPIRAWPLEHYCRLCADLLGDGHAVGIVGITQDKSLAQAITAYCRSPLCLDLTEYTKSVRQFVALCHHAALFVTNDGGPAQFAALTSVPTLIFFGPETPVLYKPLAENVHCFYLSLPCSPCLTAYNHRASPCDGDNQCLKQITPERVLAEARKILPPARAVKKAAGTVGIEG
jgi:ADP-heptose:LPS heptosyltransferase